MRLAPLDSAREVQAALRAQGIARAEPNEPATFTFSGVHQPAEFLRRNVRLVHRKEANPATNEVSPCSHHPVPSFIIFLELLGGHSSHRCALGSHSRPRRPPPSRIAFLPLTRRSDNVGTGLALRLRWRVCHRLPSLNHGTCTASRPPIIPCQR